MVYYVPDELGLGLIVKGPGITYTNQAGGYGCFHPKATGSYVWVGNYPNITGDFYKAFGGLINEGINDVIAQWINKLVPDEHWLGPIICDRRLYHESMEAWVHVIFGTEQDKLGILVWENSD